MPEATALATQYNLGQLLMTVERYGDAIRVLEDWLGKVRDFWSRRLDRLEQLLSETD